MSSTHPFTTGQPRWERQLEWLSELLGEIGSSFLNVFIPTSSLCFGTTRSPLESKFGLDTAAAYVEVPSFFGVLDSAVTDVPSICHGKGTLAVVGFDPVSLGMLKPPGEYGADIIVAEGQCITAEMNYGG